MTDTTTAATPAVTNNKAGRILKVANGELRAAYPQLAKALEDLRDAVKNSPAWGPQNDRKQLPNFTDFMKKKKGGPWPTIENRESAMTKSGMPDAAKGKVIAAMVSYHEACVKAGMFDKVTATAIEFD